MAEVTIDVGGSAMPVLLWQPQAAGPHAGVLVCMHAPGVDAFITDICNRLADAGFAAAAPDLYHRQDGPVANPLESMGRLRDDELLADLAAASAALAAAEGVDAARLAVIGFCMGGRIAFLQAASDPALKCSVVFYGGNIMQAWGDGPTALERAAGIRAPMLGLFGADDENPSPADVAAIDAELTRLGVEHEFHTWDDAGHAFLNFVRESAWRPEQAEAAWQRCVDWLDAHLAA